MVMPLAPVEVLERSRRGEPVTAAAVGAFVESWLGGGATDAQAAAWCMSVCAHGLDADGLVAVVDALVASGDRLDLTRFAPVADVRSTGGTGTGASLVAMPLAAALGVRVMSLGGRGVGWAGGVLDALDAVPGVGTTMDVPRAVRQMRDAGVAKLAPGPALVPGEPRLAALRGSTGTGMCGHLAVAAEMAAALAGGGQAVALEIPAGPGGAAADAAAAAELGALAAAAAAAWGRGLRWVACDAAEPLGAWVGNALEIRGAGEVLSGAGSPRLRRVAAALAGAAAELCGVVEAGRGTAAAEAALDDGRALAAAEAWITAQGGTAAVWTEPALLPPAPIRSAVLAPADGRLARLDARAVGEAARLLGAGRMHPVQSIDPAVGVEVAVRVGEEVVAGEPVAWVHAREPGSADRARDALLAGVEVAGGEVTVVDAVVAEG